MEFLGFFFLFLFFGVTSSIVSLRYKISEFNRLTGEDKHLFRNNLGRDPNPPSFTPSQHVYVLPYGKNECQNYKTSIT